MGTRLEQRFPWVDDRSYWRETRHAEERRPAGVGGGWVMGNGYVFAVRPRTSLMSLQSLLGPTYARDSSFQDWGAQTLLLRHQGQRVNWADQEAFRIRRTGILGAECTAERLRLLELDIAPPDWPVILRYVTVVNTSDEPLTGLQLDILHRDVPDGYAQGRVDGWQLIRPDRCLRVIVFDAAPEVGDGWLRVTLPDLMPGEDEQILIAIVSGKTPEGIELLAAKLAKNPESLANIAYHWWHTQLRGTMTVTCDDPRLGDMIDDAAVSLLCQQDPSGGIAPLDYRSWSSANEELPALLLMLRQGRSAAVRAALEARYEQSCHAGTFAERLYLGEQSPPPVHEPLWEDFRPPTAWTAWSVLRAHRAYYRETSDRELILRHFRYLRWLVEKQPDYPGGLAPMGGDEPFFPDPAALHAGDGDVAVVLGQPVPTHDMHLYAWGCASTMALTMAAEDLAELAYALHEHEVGHRARVFAETLREAVERTFWMPDDERYAAACSRVNGELYRAPHLPTMLVPYLTGYARETPEHARRALDEALQYLVDETGMPITAPGDSAIPGWLPGTLLMAMAQIDDMRRDRVYLATVSCASPAGEYRLAYSYDEDELPHDVIGHPSTLAANLQGVLDYLFTPVTEEEPYVLRPHLPVGSRRLHLEGVHLHGAVMDAVVTEREGKLHVQLGNTGAKPLNAHLVADGSTKSYQLKPQEAHRWQVPSAFSRPDLLPAPREYAPPARCPAAAPMLILTVDGETFADWQHEFNAVLLDPQLPLAPADLAHALQHDGVRRYDVLYLDVPEAGAPWANMPEPFWQHRTLLQALETFRDLGGIVAATTFIDAWHLQLPGADPRPVVSQSGWINLPALVKAISAISIVPWEVDDAEEVELLLYAADGTDLEVWVNGECRWRRHTAPEGARVRIPAIFLPGENEVAIRAVKRQGRGHGFCLGIRGKLHWNAR